MKTNAESESLSEKIRKLEGYSDVGQTSSKQGGDENNHQIWCMDEVYEDGTVESILQQKIQKQSKSKRKQLRTMRPMR